SAPPRRRRCPSCSSRVARTPRPAPCPSGTATDLRTTVCPSTRRSNGSSPRCASGRAPEVVEQRGGGSVPGREEATTDEVVAGEPDGFERLRTPHRMAYIDGPARPVAGADDEKDCPFCVVPTLPDAEGLVVARGSLAY